MRLNGLVQCDPETPVHLDRDRIAVGGEVQVRKQRIYLMMNKPRGVVTTASDDKNRETVYSVLAESGLAHEVWIAPVGRLDKASEGLLLFTNDSEWATRITAPESHLDKTYHVQIATLADEAFISILLNGVRDEHGEVLKAKRARILRSGQKNCWLEIVLDEGRNRQIRRLMSALGTETLRLIRVAIGQLKLAELPKGACRLLTTEEKLILDRALRNP